MLICPKCDIEYKEGKNFCIKCGSALVEKFIQEEQKPKIQPETPPKQEIFPKEVPYPIKPRRRKAVIGLISFLVIALVAVVIFLFIPQMYKKKDSTPTNQEIIELLSKAREYIAADKLTNPPGSNALEVSKKILSMDPGNEDALVIQGEIATKYEEWGDENYNQDDYQKAINYYKKSLSVNDNNFKVREKLAQAERMQQEQRLIEEAKLKIAEQKRLSELNIHLPLFGRKVVEKVVSLGYTPYKLLFLDNFESNKNDWALTNITNGPYLQIKNGRLLIEQRAKDQSYWEGINLKHKDFMVRLNVRYEFGNDNGAAGIFFRAKSFSDYRHFISLDLKGDCFYGLGYYDDSQSKWVYLKDWAKSDAIRSNQKNKVEAIVIGNNVHLYINGVFVTSISDLKNISGNIFGFVVTMNNTLYSFDDLCFIELKELS